MTRELDALENSLRRLRSEPRQLRKAPIDGNCFEIVQRLNAQLLVEHVDLRAAEARYAEQIEQSAGCCFAEALEVTGFSRLDQVANDGKCGGTDILDFFELARFIERR